MTAYIDAALERAKHSTFAKYAREREVKAIYHHARIIMSPNLGVPIWIDGSGRDPDFWQFVDPRDDARQAKGGGGE